MPICEYCAREHDGSYGSGRFCNPTCARQYSQTFLSEEAKARQKAPLIDPIIRAEQYERRKKEAQLRKELKEQEANEKRRLKEIEKENKKLLKEEADKSKKDKKKKKKQKDEIYDILNDPYFTSKVKIKGKHNTIFHNYKQLGDIGEASAVKKFLEHDIDTYKPVSENSKSDFIADINGDLKRIQVKTSTQFNSKENTILFGLTHGKLEIGKSSIKGKNIPYTKDEVDYFVLYNYKHDELYMIENDGSMSHKTIRLEEPENYLDHRPDPQKNLYASNCLMDTKLEELKNGIKDTIELSEDDYYVIDIK